MKVGENYGLKEEYFQQVVMMFVNISLLFKGIYVVEDALTGSRLMFPES